MSRLASLFVLCALTVATPAATTLARDSRPDGYVSLPGGLFRSALKTGQGNASVNVDAFAMMRRPVTNAQFLAFVRSHPQWRRDRVARIFAEPRYLSHWSGPLQLGPNADPQQPVVWVSWFTADAYCQAEGARLPAWSEWEYAAAADETQRDARRDPAWNERILAWYARPSNHPLPRVGMHAPNAFGVQDLPDLVWEWTADHAALTLPGDAREAGNLAGYCGDALSIDDRENYAIMMRMAMLSSLNSADATANLGFRCARDVP